MKLARSIKLISHVNYIDKQLLSVTYRQLEYTYEFQMRYKTIRYILCVVSSIWNELYYAWLPSGVPKVWQYGRYGTSALGAIDTNFLLKLS